MANRKACDVALVLIGLCSLGVEVCALRTILFHTGVMCGTAADVGRFERAFTTLLTPIQEA